MSIPAADCYWAILEAPGWKRSGVLPPGLLADLADLLPVDLSEVHAVGTPIGGDASFAQAGKGRGEVGTDVMGVGEPRGGRVLVCAVPTERLQAHISQHPGMTRLHPTAIPIELGVDLDSASHINLLVGVFEPTSVRSARRRAHFGILAAAVAVLVLLAIGLARRGDHARTVLAHARMQMSSRLAEHGHREDQLLRLSSELDALRRVAGVDLASRQAPDAAEGLAAVLGAWPTNLAVDARPQAVTIGSEGAAVGVLVAGDPAMFLAALRPPPGWTLEQPQLTRVSDQTRINLLLRPPQRSGPSTTEARR